MSESTRDHGRGVLPRLTLGEWITFGVLAGVLAGANIYTTLLIGWGDTGSIVAVLASVLLLGIISRSKPDVHTLNLGQTMVSAGGSVGFAVASYAAVYIVQPDFAPPPAILVAFFAVMGMLGALIGATVRRQMVGYFFPSGTACAVIQRTVARPVAPGERNRPILLLKLWGGLAALLTIPTKITLQDPETATEASPAHALWRPVRLFQERWPDTIAVGVDPLYYGIGIVVGPRIGLGMLLGALAPAFWIAPALAGTPLEAETGEWVKWIAIALLTLPTFAAIVFAYVFRTPPVVPPGFTPGVTRYVRPAGQSLVFGSVALVAAAGIAWCAHAVFGMPLHVTLITIGIAIPLCVVNGRVAGDTDINPVRLVAIVLLSGFFWLMDSGATALLGMAIVAGTLAAVAVDMMQDYRTGYLVDANPTHQTSVQFFGTVLGALVAIPVLSLLLTQLGGIGPDTSLPAPGAQVWAAMANAMTGGFEPSSALIQAIVWVSVLGSAYAYLGVWPATARWMPSIFGMGIGLLVGVEASAAIFLGGMIKVLVVWLYTRGKRAEALTEARAEAGNDTMLAGASVFAAAAVLSILLVLVVTVLDQVDVELFHIAH